MLMRAHIPTTSLAGPFIVVGGGGGDGESLDHKCRSDGSVGSVGRDYRDKEKVHYIRCMHFSQCFTIDTYVQDPVAHTVCQ